jgi:hypothetical protein
MMTSKEIVLQSLDHKSTGIVPIDFGGTPVSGMHVRTIAGLREHFGLTNKPVKVTEPFQMLGEIDEELMDILHIDVVGVAPRCNMFGFAQENWKEYKTHWGQTLLVAENFNTSVDAEGGVYIYPEGDTTVPPTAKMPSSGYFFDAINRQKPIDEEKLNVADNTEEFKVISDEDLKYWESILPKIINTQRAVIANFGGTAFGDIALVPGMQLKDPKGIRDVSEWYMSTLMRPDYILEVFEKQAEIALINLEKIHKVVGNSIDAVFICGTDFGTQDSTFCDIGTYEYLYHPYYKKINDWIHENTTWKTFKHCCGAVESFMESFIASGFDIINPVQINAKGMDSRLLKDKYGDRLTFWGGGVDTQKMLSFGTPAEVEKQVLGQCEIFSKNGGFVFNAVHNVQANVPIENVVAMLKAVNKFNGRSL